jgi:hypothetical protein
MRACDESDAAPGSIWLEGREPLFIASATKPKMESSDLARSFACHNAPVRGRTQEGIRVVHFFNLLIYRGFPMA